MKYYSSYTIQYVQDICNALNENGFVMHEIPMDKPFSPENFETLTDFLQHYIVMPLSTFTFLNDRGLVNRGKCPYTGQVIDLSYYWMYMQNRSVYVSYEGEQIMKKEHNEIHLKTYGFPRPKKEEREFMTENMTNTLLKIKYLTTSSCYFFGFIAFIWLAFLGQWKSIGYGLLLILGVSLFFQIIVPPVCLLSESIIKYFAKKNNRFKIILEVAFNILFINGIIIFWTFLVFRNFTTPSSHISIIPLFPWIKSLITTPTLNPTINFIPSLLWGYFITSVPLLYGEIKFAPKDIVNITTIIIGIFIATISYITLVVMWII